MIRTRKFNIVFLVVLTSFTIYTLLDTFILENSYSSIKKSNNSTLTSTKSSGEITKSETNYEDDNIKVELKTYEEYNTKIYVADITLSEASFLKTALAKNSYGKNVKEATSTIANNNNAILAINGDFYGAQEKGYVLRNGVIYRNTAKSNQEDLVIYEDGTFEIIKEEETSLESLLEKGAYNVLSFGPALIENYNVSVTKNDEVGKSMASNPRTLIGMIDDLHYVFIVSDGRTSESEGLSLYELATFAKKLNIKTAYNLDGGGSSTMYFNGKVINNPTTSGRNISERSVSDIVYIGY